MINSFTKRVFLALLLCFCFGQTQAVTIKKAITSAGFWCDLICLRKEINLQGLTVPFSAHKNALAFGFLNEAGESMMGYEGEYLEYNSDNNTMTFYRNNGETIVLSVSTNTIVSDAVSKKTYFVPTVFTGCDCSKKVIASTATSSGVPTTTTQTTGTVTHGGYNPATYSSVDVNIGNGCYPYVINNCPDAAVSRQGVLLPQGCLRINEKLTSFGDTSGSAPLRIYKWWAAILPAVESSFSEATSEKYGELARGMLCDHDLHNFRIDYVDSRYIIADRSRWWDEEIWITDSLVQYVKYCNVQGLCEHKKGTGDAVMAVFVRPKEP